MPSVELPEFQSLIVEGSQSCCTIKKKCQTTLSQTHKHLLHIEPGTAATWIFVRGYIVSTPEAVFPILCPDNWNGCTFVFWILDYTKMEIQYSYTKLPVNIDSRWLNITHIYIYTYIYIYRYTLRHVKHQHTFQIFVKSLVLRRHATGDFGSLEYCGHSPVAQLAATACGRGVSGRTWCLKFRGMIVDRPTNTRRHFWRVEILALTDLWQIVWRTSNSFRWHVFWDSCFVPFSKPTGLPTSFKCSQQATDLE